MINLGFTNVFKNTFGEKVLMIESNSSYVTKLGNLKSTEYINGNNTIKIKVGSVVDDEMFGLGEVKKIEDNDGQVQIGIDFERIGYRYLPINTTKLRLLGVSEIKKESDYNDSDDVDYYEMLAERDMEYNPVSNVAHRFSSKPRNSNLESVGPLAVGDCVEHILLGRGKVIKIQKQEKDNILTIDFERAGKIELLMSKANTKIKKLG